MNKRDLVTLIARDSDYTRREVREVIDKTFRLILEHLGRGEEVGIINFGSFKLKHHKARKGYNPKTKKRIEIPEKVTVEFTPSKKMTISQEALQQLAQQAKEKK